MGHRFARSGIERLLQEHSADLTVYPKKQLNVASFGGANLHV